MKTYALKPVVAPQALAWGLSALVACAASALFQPAHAQVMHNPSVEQLISALDTATIEPVSKAFRRTLPPDANNLCPEGQTDSGGTGKNVVIVPYHMQPSARVDIPLQFAKTSDQLDASDKRVLDNLAQAMNSPQLQGAGFALAGHASATGPDALNNELSCSRALAVRRYLIQRGIPVERLTAYGFGSSRLLPGRAGNDATHQRVEVNRE